MMQSFCFPLQEIDGKALLLLRSDMMMKYMGLKLGPALKLTFHIDKLKRAWGQLTKLQPHLPVQESVYHALLIGHYILTIYM